MLNFLKTTPSLSTAIQQLDKIASDFEDKQFAAVDLEEKPVLKLHSVNKPSFNYLLAIHHCRIGWLFAKNEKWNEAVKHFTSGLSLPCQKLAA